MFYLLSLQLTPFYLAIYFFTSIENIETTITKFIYTSYKHTYNFNISHI